MNNKNKDVVCDHCGVCFTDEEIADLLKQIASRVKNNQLTIEKPNNNKQPKYNAKETIVVFKTKKGGDKEFKVPLDKFKKTSAHTIIRYEPMKVKHDNFHTPFVVPPSAYEYSEMVNNEDLPPDYQGGFEDDYNDFYEYLPND